ERVERTTLLRRNPGARRAGARQRLVGIDGHDDVLRVAAHVADVDRGSRSKQILAEEIPLMRELRSDVGIPCPKLTGWSVERLQPLEARGERARTGRPVVRDLRFEKERRVERQALVGASAFHVLRDPVAAPEHPARTLAVSDPEPWFPTVVV